MGRNKRQEAIWKRFSIEHLHILMPFSTRVCCYSNEGQFAEAQTAFQSMQDSARWAEAKIPLAEINLGMDKPELAIELLHDSLSLVCPDWKDIYRAELLFRAELAVGNSDLVGSALEEALESQPRSPQLLTLAAIRRHFLRDPENAELLFKRALVNAGLSDRQQILIRSWYFPL